MQAQFRSRDHKEYGSWVIKGEQFVGTSPFEAVIRGMPRSDSLTELGKPGPGLLRSLGRMKRNYTEGDPGVSIIANIILRSI